MRKLLQWITALLSVTVGASATTKAAQNGSEQAVIVHFIYGSKDLGRLFQLEDTLEKEVSQSGKGEYDGHEIAIDGSDGFFYIYGPDADALFLVVRPVLEAADFTRGATVKLRYGPVSPSTEEAEVHIRPGSTSVLRAPAHRRMVNVSSGSKAATLEGASGHSLTPLPLMFRRPVRLFPD